MKNILIAIVIILVLVESYIIFFSESATNEIATTPKIPLPTSTPAPTTSQKQADHETPSYPQIYSTETVDQSWANETEKQIVQLAVKSSANYDKYFTKVFVACKTSICKLELGIELTDQPFPIMVAGLVYEMKKQGWQSDIAVMDEKITDNLTSGNATVYLINPTR